VDGLDAGSTGLARRVDAALLAVHDDLPVVRRVDPRQQLDQRTFASAVVAEQAHHLASVQGAAGALDRVDATEALVHALHVDYTFGLQGLTFDCLRASS
jgi:hypothetical protein